MNIFLDDIRSPADAANYMPTKDVFTYLRLPWIVVRSYEEFTNEILQIGIPELVSFDHDLGDEHILLGHAKHTNWNEYYKQENREMTGYDCAKWLGNCCLDLGVRYPKYIVHSQNPVGRENIIRYIENFKKHG